MLSFSTCWNNHRHNDGEAVIDEILELGFSNIELSHGMTITKLPGFQKAFADGRFTCSGVHNFFPSPTEVMIDAPDAYEFSAPVAYDRERAMEMTERTLDYAAEFKAKYVVLHMGSVPKMPHSKWSGKLIQTLKKEGIESPQFKKIKIKCEKRRKKKGIIPFSHSMVALEKIAAYAEKVGVPVAVESRSKYEDIPYQPEMLFMMEHFKDNPWVGYWHDFGHVQLQHQLTFNDHEEWLKTFHSYLIGGHLHDVEEPMRDHRVPFTGIIDYDQLVPYFPSNCPIVWELSPTRKSAQIREALEIWKQKFPERT